MKNDFMFFCKKNRSICVMYILYTIYNIIKSCFFYFGGFDFYDYIDNFTNGNCFFLEALPIYLLIISNVLNQENKFAWHRYTFRNKLFSHSFRQGLVYTIIHVTTVLFIVIFFCSTLYDVSNTILLINIVVTQLTYFFGYLILLNLILFMININIFAGHIYLPIYFYFVLEYYVIFDGVFSKQIPISLTWMFWEKTNLLIKLFVLVFICRIMYKLTYNKSLEREF